MKYDPFENREDVDHEHVIKVGSVTVFFLKESDGKSLNEATAHLYIVIFTLLFLFPAYFLTIPIKWDYTLIYLKNLLKYEFLF